MATPIRFGGIASGMDTDKMIKDLMKVERMPVDKIKQQKQTVMWKRDEYRTMNSTLTSIRSIVDKMRFATSFNKQNAVSSNNGVVTATSSASAVSGSYSIRVDKLASSAVLIGAKNPIDVRDKISFNGDFEVNGVNIHVDSDDTYESVMKKISNSKAGATISYDSINKSFMMSSTSTGSSAKIEIKDPNGDFAKIFNITSTSAQGTNAEVVLNGKKMELENNSFEFNGVKFDLKGVSTSDVSVTATRDTGDIVSQIKEFVKQYNDLVDKVNQSTSARPNRNYRPLTEEEREGMTEKQIDLWESKAKVGLLYRDDILQETVSTLRRSLVDNVKGLGEPNSLSDIGITFKGYLKGMTGELGKLEIDEQKLQDAVNKNPDAVMQMFTKTSNLDQKDPNYKSETGYADRLYTDLTNQINKIIKRIGSGKVSDAVDNSQYGRDIDEMNKRMQTLESRVALVEKRYYKQFTAMEKALQKLNSQGSWLSQQLGQ
ncbi:flagellar filament capping protein FliD [Paenibacillus sp. chi10]|uniref:Flagellar hook-associated protein 2 n=1 Tax=Paenibacillus suaedae TaxID=3077233 RepID=A0AAJ2K0M1_9BACL|nr:flagellar filament capping protein FliD [Paenibacillus sp. chi10]MDT8979817.1 flagellar filament capping protein FliD [Paenibacillus sp. chi10]